MKIAEALSAAADKSGMSDVEIAAAIGVSQATVVHWKRGRKSPSGKHLVALVRVLPVFGKLVGLSNGQTIAKSAAEVA